jgi:uncharacterized protein YecT (DUF1311 family)
MRNSKLPSLIFLLIAFSSIWVKADFTPDYSNLDGGQQKAQSLHDLQDARIRLEKAYHMALSEEKDHPKAKQKLIASQKAWEAYRDAAMNYFTPTSKEDWGSGTLVFLRLAEIKLIDQRIHALTSGDVYQ